MGAGTFSDAERGRHSEAATAPICPACNEGAREAAIERYGKYELFGCGACGLQFWEPRELPDAQWYEQMYGGRDENLLPLEPGHKYFLADPLAPRNGELLDIGCGTGNFLAAARGAGYGVTGIELDRNAARFAKERLGLQKVLPLTISEFAEQHAEERFDVVTFFEVLEHQAAPVEFLQKVKACVRPRGMIALSVPNRERWMTGPDVLDYPPNHFLRWNAAALRNILRRFGFQIVSVRQQPVDFPYAVSMINMALRSGLTRKVTGREDVFFRDVMQMDKAKAVAVSRETPSARQRVMSTLGKVKRGLCYPLAGAALPYLRLRGYKAAYLYCLAKLC